MRESTIREGGLPPHSQMSRCDSRKSRGGVACVGASPWELPHSRKSVWRLGSQGWLRYIPKVAIDVPQDTIGVSGVAMGDPGVAMGVPVGWS